MVAVLSGMEKRLEILMENRIPKIDIVDHPLFRKYGDDIINAVSQNVCMIPFVHNN